MNFSLQTKPGVQYYAYGQGQIDGIVDVLKEYQAKRVLVLHGGISWEIAKPFFERVLAADFHFVFEQYHGECSYVEAKRVSDVIEAEKIDFVMAVGGGKLCDLTKLAASYTMTPYGVTPTLASNCAPWAALSVMYKENGMSEGKTEHQKHNAAYLITDPDLLVTTPERYFIAGIADTLVKWYESDLVTSQESLVDYPMIKMGRYAAKLCKEDLLAYADQALNDLRAGITSSAFQKVAEIIITISGLVGGLAGKYARNTAAHTMHDGISKYFPQVHEYLHGEKVAYGTFYQLALEGKWEEIDSLVPLYQRLNLPISLTQMGAYPIDEASLEELLAFMDSKEKVHLLPLEINQTTLRKALVDLEDYMTKFTKEA